MSLKEPPFTQPIADPETGMMTLPWIDYFRFWETINDKVNLISNPTAGNIVKVAADGSIIDGGSQFAISYFSAYDTTGEIALGAAGAYVDVDWDTETHKDNDFSHDDETPGTDITCNFDGRVDVTFYGTLYVDTWVNTSVATCKCKIFDTDSWAGIGGILAQIAFETTSARPQFNITQSTAVYNGYKIKSSFSVTTGGSTIKTVAGACGIRIARTA